MALYRSLQELQAFADPKIKRPGKDLKWLADQVQQLEKLDYRGFTCQSLGNLIYIVDKYPLTAEQRVVVLQVLCNYYKYAKDHPKQVGENGVSGCVVELLRTVVGVRGEK